MRVSIGGAIKVVASAKCCVDNATFKSVSTTKGCITGVWKTGEVFIAPPTATLSNYAPQGYDATGSEYATTSAVTVTPVGTGPFSYSWSRTTGAGAADSPTLATTTFTAAIGYFASITGGFRVTVTDALGQTTTADLTATFTGYIDLGGF